MTTSSRISAQCTILASELLPVLLVLYPVLLLLDDGEPGFVRSVFNPHWCLLAIVAAATLAGNTGPASSWSRHALLAWSIGSGVVVGTWMWGKLGGGALAAVVAAIAATTIAAVVEMAGDESWVSE